jgi:hypothetical protein
MVAYHDMMKEMRNYGKHYWMFALRGLALHWIECPIPRTLILRSNANIFVWMFRYSKTRLDIVVECQMLFG